MSSRKILKMKSSDSEAALSSQQAEPLEALGDVVEFTQAGLAFEPQRVQEQGNVGAGSIQAASRAVHQSTKADLRLELGSFQDIERGTITVDSGVAVQPTQASLGLQSHSFQEQPDVEERSVQADVGVVVQPTQAAFPNPSIPDVISMDNSQAASGAVLQSTQAGLGLESSSFQDVDGRTIQADSEVAVQPTQRSLRIESYSSQEQPIIQERFMQTQVALPNLSDLDRTRMDDWHGDVHFTTEELDFLEEVLQIPNDQEGGINDKIVLQNPSDMNLGIDLVEASPQEEEEAGANDRTVPLNPCLDMNYPHIVDAIELADLEEPTDGEEATGVRARTTHEQMQERPPQQGRVRHRMRLQVSSLYSATDCKGCILRLQHSDATSSCIEPCATFPKDDSKSNACI